MIIGVDFDGTCVEHKFPEIGLDVPYACKVLRDLVDNGHKLILWTMRSGEPLDDAVNWFKEKDITLFGINNNPDQDKWTDSPKAYCQLYIDDAALGCPLRDGIQGRREMVNWGQVGLILNEMGMFRDI